MAQTKNGYVPANVQKAMDQHMQQMPANLKKYQNGQAYIPAHAQQAMTDYMKKTMPAHMQEYISPYMHQQVTAGLNSLDPAVPRSIQPRAPAPDLMRRDHSAFGEQLTVNTQASVRPDTPGSLAYTPQYAPPPGDTSQPPPEERNPYEFILQDAPPNRRGLGGAGFKKRLLMVIGGGVVLLMLFAIVMSVLSSGNKGNTVDLVSAAKQQQELIHVTDSNNPNTNQARAALTQNLAVTANLSLVSAQQDLLAYLAKHGQKLEPKTLQSAQDSQLDAKLAAAAENNQFDQTFTSALSEQLATYQATLKRAYDATTNASGKQLLSNEYQQAGLLLNQAKTQANSGG